MQNRRSRQIPGEHVVRCLGVIGDTARDRSHHRNFVRDLSGTREIFVENNSRNRCFGYAKRPAVFDRRFRLGIPGFLVGKSARQDDLDHTFGFAFRPRDAAVKGADFAGPGVHLEQIG